MKIIIIIFVLFGLYACDESTVNEPKSEFEEFTDKVWVYKHSNIGTFEDFSPQKMKFNQDSTCQILINNNWESGEYSFFRSTQSNDIYGLTVNFDKEEFNKNKYYFYNWLQFKTISKDSLVVHFGMTEENSWHTYVPEK
jgi:hypothetical protein